MKKQMFMALILTFVLTACGNAQTATKETGTSVQSSEAATLETTTADRDLGVEPETKDKTEENSEETSGESSQETKEQSSMVNPMHKVTSSEDFKQIDLNLTMYEDETWVEVDSFYIIGGNVAEINFHDKMTDSNAYVRTAKAELGDISGLYYKFEEEETKLVAKSPSGEDINITLNVLVEGADIPGALATWTYGGTNYFLWEDNGKNQPDTVGKLAVEVAKTNAK